MTPAEFYEQWKGRNLTERESSQTHFRELCALLGVPAPYDVRALDNDYKFDAITAAAGSYGPVHRPTRRPRASQSEALFDIAPEQGQVAAESGRPEQPQLSIVSATDSHGFADVWKRGCFCWEYKRQGKHRDLNAALDQLRRYRDSLDNPPLLIVCDVDHYEIHTNFTGYPTEVYRFSAEELANPTEIWLAGRGISPLQLLRKVFDRDQASEYFRPKRRLDDITAAFAARVAQLAVQLDPAQTEDGHPVTRQEVAHFLMQIVFSLFAEDVDLLPSDRVTRLLQQGNEEPKGFTRKIRALFKAMEKGGDFGEDTIEWFNGGLFKDVDKQRFPKLVAAQLGIFVAGDDKNWSAIEPSILGTLFERALDPKKRSQIGAHYTSRDDIMLVIEPVVLAPLRREWAAAQQAALALVPTLKSLKSAARKPVHDQITKAIRSFHERLASVTILDPACGSGNFLYVAIQCLLDLEREVLAFAALPDIAVKLTPRVNPTQLRGIEIDPYAAELARISIWIGFLKWKKEKGLYDKQRPILAPLDTIENRDAVLVDLGNTVSPRRSTTKRPTARPASWPEADFIIGNPPFLGSTKFKGAGVAAGYKRALEAVYSLRGKSDLCCAWFEHARWAVNNHPTVRVGLLGNTTIRYGVARDVLDRIAATGVIFDAWSNKEWINDGAAVRTCIVCFTKEQLGPFRLDGRSVDHIGASLQTALDLSGAVELPENGSLSFEGDQKGGPFDISWEDAASLLSQPSVSSEARRPLRRRMNASDLTKERYAGGWVIDFGPTASRESAAQHDSTFQLLQRLYVVAESRAKEKGKPFNKRARWWVHKCARPEMLAALAPLSRVLVTSRVGTHRAFRFIEPDILPDSRLFAFARDDDYFFGVLQSAVHEIWALVLAPPHGAGNDPTYNNTRCFETFPLPWPPGLEPLEKGQPHHSLWSAIGSAAQELNALREKWLNPPEWIVAVERLVDIRHKRELADIPADIRPLIRRSAVMAEAAKDPNLKTRTLTNLYNQRPAWLRLAHEKLDRAVLAAYREIDPKGGWDPDWAKVYEPFGAGEIVINSKGKSRDPEPVARAKQAAIAAREPIDAKILANLLRLNHARSRPAKGNPSRAGAKPKKPPRKS